MANTTFEELPLELTHKENMDYIWKLLFNINHSSRVTPLIQEQKAKLGTYYALEAPENLFRYRPLENDMGRELDALKNQKMWFSAKIALNDIFEAHVKEPDIYEIFGGQIKVFNNLLEELDNMLKNHHEQKEEMRQIKAKIRRLKIFVERSKADIEQGFQPCDEQNHIDEFWKSAAISCLSERNDSILMWSHYASENRGMCIEYCTQKLVQNSHFVLAPVNYSYEPPYRKEYSNNEAYLMSAIFTKASDWKYEQEWRCVIARSADEVYDSRAPFGWKENGEVIGGALLDTAPAKALYLGCNIDENSLEKIVSLCKDVLNIPVFKMEMSLSEYKLIPKILYSPT